MKTALFLVLAMLTYAANAEVSNSPRSESLSTTTNIAKPIDPTNERPFLNGELDPNLETEAAVIKGKIIQIVGKGDEKRIYKVDLGKKGFKPIWVTTLVLFSDNQIKLGDELVFKGYVAKTKSLDFEGELTSKVSSSTMFLAKTIETP